MFVGLPPLCAGFANAIEYLCHDPRPDGRGSLPTAERVAYIGVRNLPRCGLGDLANIMETTVGDADELRALAGGAPQGAKTSKPVFRFVLSWAPGEDPSLDEVRQAVSEFLVAVGLEARQVVFSVHIDTDCIHVHGVTNRVHPHTGRAADVWHAAMKGQIWARSWEETHGGVRCHRRLTAEEAQAWSDLWSDQRTDKVPRKVARREQAALAKFIDDRREARGEPPAARPGRSAPFRWPRRESSEEERALWAQQFERHRREGTPADVRRRERRELAERIDMQRRDRQQAVRERGVAVDIDVDAFVAAKDAPRGAGRPGGQQRWDSVENVIIPAAEAHLRETVLGRLRQCMPRHVADEMLSVESSHRNGFTEPHSLERYRGCDNLVDRQATESRYLDLPIWAPNELARCQRIRERADDAGVPTIDAYAQAPPLPSQIAWPQFEGLERKAIPHGGHPQTALRWTYLERHVIPRWETAWSVWRAGLRSRPRVLERRPAAAAHGARPAVEPEWIVPRRRPVESAGSVGGARPVEPVRADLPAVAPPGRTASPARSEPIAETHERDVQTEDGWVRRILSWTRDVRTKRRARKEAKRQARWDRILHTPTLPERTADDRTPVTDQPKEAVQSRRHDIVVAEPAAKGPAPTRPGPPRRPVQSGGNEDFTPPSRPAEMSRDQLPASQQRQSKPSQDPSR